MTQAPDERGFTLVEVLVTVVVLGVVIAALGAGFSVGLRTMDSTANRLAGSMDAQLLGVHLPDDVASATSIDATPSSITCVGVASPVLQLGDGASFDVVYGVGAGSGTHRLERHDCAGGSVRSTIVVARNLAGPAAAVATRTATGATLTITGATVAADATPFVFSVTGTRRAS